MTANAPPPRCRPRRAWLRGSLLVPIALAVALSACTSSKPDLDPMTTASVPTSASELEKAAAYWGKRYQAKPKDKAVALNYAAALRRSGHDDQALIVLQRAALDFPTDRTVYAAYGKVLAAGGQLEQALAVIRKAESPDKPDWHLISAEAAILDQLGQHDDARKLYSQCLDLAPNEPTVLSNLGMSYVLTGDLKEAERVLRTAAALPNADSRVRQNLALVVGLSGHFADAEKIASADLSPDEAAANVAYLKQMLAQSNNWQKLKASDGPQKLAATN
jgi:Flp pilus assembly protein TadD